MGFVRFFICVMYLINGICGDCFLIKDHMFNKIIAIVAIFKSVYLILLCFIHDLNNLRIIIHETRKY